MAIVNTAATWKPDGDQNDPQNSRRITDSIYIMDRQKVLVAEMGLKDDNYVLTFRKDGKPLYSKAGHW